MPDVSNAPDGSTDPMIRLSGVTKHYEGSNTPAVAPLTMDIQRGEFVCLVGPSGCGKTTTLRMINRLVEPSAGQIWIDGRDVTHSDPDELRRHIGYVIQQVGLIPHMSIGQNVGIVPSMLRWDKQRVSARVDELLELVGLDPSVYRSRYPKQLSGGQQQRVGVARALAADPPVMLMDEPFGAIDPITRERLQAEFLQIQQRIRKTIVFVTHDIDEALRLGDRIAIFAEGSRLAQFDTPLEILTNPADDFVRSFIGEGAALRRLSLLRVEDLPASVDQEGPADLTVGPDESVAAVLEKMLMTGAARVHVVGGATRTVQDMLLATSLPKQSTLR
ncbi:osmoprotectant transport system ATP-binding protein [Modestobacter sp. DSM 44400]|uniref:ABC transporter ATP-binding protein n=1 Tax=Modestobacter sp. DSM 44400 TaxID=1550230 RepID=UPI000895DA6F|nr:ABC transporter ATP-binding protein [Modestobacter sp. DSM 44400]SDY72550.1 osmoprotectant transport system ATP-binding protein [Modestobacter sp. DSM 44400]